MPKEGGLRESLITEASSQQVQISKAKEAPGRLRVRCLGARDVHPFQVQIFGQGATYDPYAVLCIRRTVGDRYQKSRKRWTHAAGKTRHPCWREEFWFTLPTCPWEAEYVLEATIYGASQGRRHDEFLGYAELPLSTVQSEARLVEELPLGPPVGSAASAESEGRIRIELMWESACSKQTDTFLRFVWRGMNTVMGLRFFSIAILAIAGLLLMVAQGSRWLCSGHTFADCHELEVPGARVAAVLGSMSAVASGITNFLGVAGFFGSAWREGAPMGLLDDVQSSYVDHQDDLAPSGWRQHSAPTLQLQVQQKHLFVWDVSVMAVDICPVKISLPSVRLLTWFGQGVALIMAQLTILLAWLEDAGPSRFLGEAVYLAFLAFVMLLTSAILSGREAFLSQPSADERWSTTEDKNFRPNRPRRYSYDDRPGQPGLDGRAWSPGRAVSGIEDFMANVEEGVRAVKHEAEALRQPFVAAGEEWNSRMKNFMQELEQQVRQPILEAAERFQGQIETQRQSFQDQFRNVREDSGGHGCILGGCGQADIVGSRETSGNLSLMSPTSRAAGSHGSLTVLEKEIASQPPRYMGDPQGSTYSQMPAAEIHEEGKCTTCF